MQRKSRPSFDATLPATAFKDASIGDAFARLMSTPRTDRQQTVSVEALEIEFPWLNDGDGTTGGT